jgi:site-specific DNA-methyltransferase (adenine-specific)
MKPYYEHAGITIYHGDSLLVDWPLDADLLLTDPMYGNSANILGKSSRRGERTFKGLAIKPKDWELQVSDDEPFDPRDCLYYPEAILWGGNYYSSKLPDSQSWIVWDKRAGGSSDDNADCELAWSNIGGPARIFTHLWRGWIRAGRENIAVEGDKLHPFQKPYALMCFCLALSRTTGPVFDPYMGSGTVLVAAKDLGRKAIGIEIEEKYCEIAAKRLSQEVLDFAPKI